MSDLRYSKETGPVLSSERHGGKALPSIYFTRMLQEPAKCECSGDRHCLHIIWSCGWRKCVTGGESLVGFLLNLVLLFASLGFVSGQSLIA